MLKSLERRFFLIIMCCFMGVWPGSGICVGAEAVPQMTASLVPNQTNVGGIVTLTLKFHLPTGAQFAPEPVVKGLAGFRILDQQMIPDDAQQKTDGKKSPGTVVSGEYRLRLMVNRLDSGAVGPISLPYVNADGEKASLKAPTVPFTVLSNLGGKTRSGTAEAHLRNHPHPIIHGKIPVLDSGRDCDSATGGRRRVVVQKQTPESFIGHGTDAPG